MSRFASSVLAAAVACGCVAGLVCSAFIVAAPPERLGVTPRSLPSAEGPQTEHSAKWYGAALGCALLAGAALRSASTAAARARSAGTQRLVGVQAEPSETLAKTASVASTVLLTGAVAVEPAAAYPIFAQQNYATPLEGTGKIVCANCHLAERDTLARIPQQVLPDTIFKAQIDVPAKYEKRMQPLASGEKGPMNVGAVVIMPEGFKLAPKNRLPKPLKKEMKGLAWAPFSKQLPNAVVAGPVPGSRYERMILPILSPDPNTDKDIHFNRYTFFFGGNRGRGQVYPEGNISNNNQFFANATGTITAIDGLKVTITKADGGTEVVECLPGADIVYTVGEKVEKGDPITTNPNVGGFGQEEKELTLQDINRVYAYCAIATSIFFAQLTFVLKKKQFEKVQLAEGF